MIKDRIRNKSDIMGRNCSSGDEKYQPRSLFSFYVTALYTHNLSLNLPLCFLSLFQPCAPSNASFAELILLFINQAYEKQRQSFLSLQHIASIIRAVITHTSEITPKI